MSCTSQACLATDLSRAFDAMLAAGQKSPLQLPSQLLWLSPHQPPWQSPPPQPPQQQSPGTPGVGADVGGGDGVGCSGVGPGAGVGEEDPMILKSKQEMNVSGELEQAATFFPMEAHSDALNVRVSKPTLL